MPSPKMSSKKLLKSEVLSYSITSIRHGADPGFLAVSPQVTFINTVVGCCYFSPDPQLLSQPKRPPLWWYQTILLGDIGRQVQVACPRPLRNDAQPGLEPAKCESQVCYPANSATVSKK